MEGQRGRSWKVRRQGMRKIMEGRGTARGSQERPGRSSWKVAGGARSHLVECDERLLLDARLVRPPPLVLRRRRVRKHMEELDVQPLWGIEGRHVPPEGDESTKGQRSRPETGVEGGEARPEKGVDGGETRPETGVKGGEVGGRLHLEREHLAYRPPPRTRARLRAAALLAVAIRQRARRRLPLHLLAAQRDGGHDGVIDKGRVDGPSMRLVEERGVGGRRVEGREHV